MKLQPIIPFEPIDTVQFPTGPQWVAQVKWDGVRMLTYFDGSEVRLFNRRLNERTRHYPEVTDISSYSSAKSVIYDGEMIALNNGRPSFYEIMKRDGIRRLEKVGPVSQRVPVTYMIFDILYLNGQWLTLYSLEKRQDLLRTVTKAASTVQMVDNFNDSEGLYHAVKSRDMEGIVLKDLTSTYAINGKDNRWRKKKVYRDLIAVVGGVTFRDEVVNSLLLGLYDETGTLWYIGHAGTGKLTHHDWRQVTDLVRPLIQSDMPFAKRPARHTDAIWLLPALSVKVRYAEWTEGHTLRHPSIDSFVSVDIHECRFDG